MSDHKDPIDHVRWEPVGLEDYMDGRRYFPIQAVEEVINSTGCDLPPTKIRHHTVRRGKPYSVCVSRRSHLRRALEAEAHWFRLESVWFAEPRNADLANALDEIIQRSGDLLLALGARDKNGSGLPATIPFRIQEGLTEGGAGHALESTVGGLINLRQWANAAADKKRGASVDDIPRNGRPPEEAKDELVARLARIYQKVFQLRPGSGDRGPFSRFVVAFSKQSGIHSHSDEALIGRIKRVLINIRKSGAEHGET